MDIGFCVVPREDSGEKNDCAVRAYVNATGTPYRVAHALFSQEGRRYRGRTPWSITNKLYGQLGPKQNCHMTTGEFIRQFRRGTYILHVRGHVFAVKDGVIHDMGVPRPRAVVTFFWVVNEAPQALTAPVVCQDEPEEIIPVRTAPRTVENIWQRLERLKNAQIASPTRSIA